MRNLNVILIKMRSFPWLYWSLFSTFILFLLFFIYFLILINIYDLRKVTKSYSYYDSKKKDYVFVDVKPKIWVRVKSLPITHLWAFLVSEDWRFYNHPGVDFLQLHQVVMDGIEKGRFTRGASTITQQVVKNLLLTKERSYLRKINEIILSLYLERITTKKRILEVYLNIAQMGDDIYGLGMASQSYFKKKASQLSVVQISFLSALLPSPKRYYKEFKSGKKISYIEYKLEVIMQRLRHAKIISGEDLNTLQSQFETQFNQLQNELP